MNTKLTIGQVARETGISAKTIRYYEDIRLLEPAKRMDNKYREYSEEDIVRLRLIKQAKSLGLTLDEIKQLVGESMDGTCEDFRQNFLNQLPLHIASVNKRILELQSLKQQLEHLQKSVKTLPLTNPKKQVKEKNQCEVLKHIEQAMSTNGKGVKTYGI